MIKLQNKSLAGRIIKVNHAGENGAVNIYKGQIMVAQFFSPHLISQLKECLEHEKKHRNIFQVELERLNTRKCRSYHLCGLGGFLLGFITAFLGHNAIASTTVAVEKVVLGHLHQQLKQLKDIDDKACQAIEKIIIDEQSHHDQFLTHLNEKSIWVKVLMPIVSVSTQLVIWTGMEL